MIFCKHIHLLLKERLRAVVSISYRSAVDLAHTIHGKIPNDSDPPIIVIHGILDCKKSWESMSRRIVQTMKKSVIAVDVRNHGESPSHSSHTYPDLASDISKLITKLSLTKATIIGHSMGGRTAMFLALTEPEKVVNLVIVDVSPIYEESFLNIFLLKLIDVMKTIDFKGVNNCIEARALAKNKIMASGVIKNEKSTDFILMNIGKRLDGSYGWKYNIDTLKEYLPFLTTFPAEVKGEIYSGPTLFVGGDKSDYLPPEHITRIRAYFPNAEMIHLPNVHHNIHIEDPAAFLETVVNFLQEK